MAYSTHHADMASATRTGCGDVDSNRFGKQGGITNGAKWYSLQGGNNYLTTLKIQEYRRNFWFVIAGMQDFNYLSSNDFELTLELGCEKYPPAKLLHKEWERNKHALINFMWQVSVQKL